MQIVVIAGVIQDSASDAFKNLPYHAVGETIGGFLYHAVQHGWGMIVIPLRTEAGQIGHLLLRFTVVQKIRDKAKTTWAKLYPTKEEAPPDEKES